MPTSRPSSVATVFGIPELLHAILAELLVPDAEGDTHEASIAYCAAVCKQWAQVALPLAWSTDYHMHDLIKLSYPRAMPAMTHSSEGSPTSALNQEKLRRWSRVAMYMTFIKSIDVEIAAEEPEQLAKTGAVHPRDIELIATIATTVGQPMFPAINRISIDLYDTESCTAGLHILRLGAPKIAISFGDQVDEAGFLLVLDAIRESQSTLRDLDLYYSSTGVLDHTSRVSAERMLYTISSLSRLQKLTLSTPLLIRQVWDPAQSTSLPHLAHFECMRPLLFGIPKGLANMSIGLSCPGTIMLHLAAPAFHSMLSMSPISTSLRSCMFIIKRTQEPDLLSHALENLARIAPNLCELTLGLYGQPVRVDAAAFASLRLMRNLRALDLTINGLEEVTDLTFELVAASCPHIASLTFLPSEPLAIPKELSLHSLRHIARHCRNIEKLCIRLDATREGLEQASEHVNMAFDSTLVLSPTLEELNFEFSTISSAASVATILSYFFPLKAGNPTMLGFGTSPDWGKHFRIYFPAPPIPALRTTSNSKWHAVRHLLTRMHSMRAPLLSRIEELEREILMLKGSHQ